METVHLFLADGFEEVEALTVVDVLRRANVRIQTVSVSGERCVTSSHNVSIESDLLFNECEFDRSTMFVLPGGMPGALNLYAHQGLAEALIAQSKAGKPIAAICAAPMVLGRLGLLENRRVTCYPGFENELKGAHYTGELIEKDGNLITGKGPAAAMPFALSILAFLTNNDKAKDVAGGLLYNELVP